MIQTVIQTLIPLIKTVVSTPNVYDHLPMQADMTLLKDAVAHNGRLHVYTVTRPNAALGQRGANFAAFDHQISIEGRLAYQGSVTQQLLDNELDAILSLLAARSFGDSIVGTESLRLAENRPYAYYNQAIHYGRIELEVRIL